MTTAEQRGLDLLQFVAQTDSRTPVEPFLAEGFEALAEPVFMERPARPADASMTVAEALQLDTFCPEMEADLSRVLLQTFRGTLDCCNIKRTAKMDRNVLATNRRKGDLDPLLWWLVRVEAEPVGCLLINQSLRQKVFEISYIAVLPECRGKAYGRQLVRKAIAECARRRPDWPLVLDIDVRNTYALDIYRRLGFKRQATKRVYCRLPA